MGAPPAQHLFVINDAPDGMLTRELASWIAAMRLWRKVLFVNAGERDEAAQYNVAIAEALKTRRNYFLFCDCDIRPTVEGMAPFWAADYDVVGVRYATENPDAWREGDEIHAALWRTSRNVLETVGAPWFLWEYDKEHTHVTKCLCRNFCDKVKAAGFTVGVAGEAEHWPREKRRQ